MSVLSKKLGDLINQTGAPAPLYSGRVHRFDGHMIECDGFPATIGTLCSVATQENGEIIAEIIGFQNNNNLCCTFIRYPRVLVLICSTFKFGQKHKNMAE